MREAIIIGAGAGLSAALARKLSGEGRRVTLAARDIGKLEALCAETGARALACDAADPASVRALFDSVAGEIGAVVYNPSYRIRGPVAELDPEEVRKALEITAFGAFLAGQQAAARMLTQPLEDGRRGTILFTGATAGVKGFPLSAPFAMGKFAERGLAQSMSRELHPKGIHVAWINIDGGIRSERNPEPGDEPASRLDPDAIAETYMALVRQHPSAWSEELAVRPWVERF